MRTRVFGFLVLVVSMLSLLGQSRSQAQGGKGFSMNPDDIFNKYANGKEVIVMSELDAQTQERLKRLAGFMGIPITEKITRDEFKKHVGGVTAMMQSGALPFKGFGGGGAPPSDTQGPPTGDPKGGPRSPSDRESAIEAVFRKMDKNNDGTLSADEVPENMQREREEYDKNHDGFIDLAEFKAFAAVVRPPRESDPSRSGSDRPRTDTSETRKSETPAEEIKPTIYRIGKLPKDLPEWFIRLDKAGDCDGQVGLWEARYEKSVMDEFTKYDLNGDGLLTAEEVLKYKASLRKTTDATSVASTSADRDKDKDKDRDLGPSRGAPSLGSGGPPSGGFSGAPPSTDTTPSSSSGFRGSSTPPATTDPSAKPAIGTPPTGSGDSKSPTSFGKGSGSDSGTGGSGFRSFSGFGKGGTRPPSKN